MSSKKWVLVFLATVLVLAAPLARLILPLGEFSPEELDDLAEELKF